MLESYRRYVTGIGIIILIFAGCDSPTDFQPDDTPEIMESSFGEATFGEDTTIIDDETMDKLTGVSEDGTVFTFQGTDPVLKSLENKEFLILGRSALTPFGALRRIEEVRRDGDIFEITTSDATLEEAFENLEISFNELLSPNQVDSISYKVPSLGIHRKMTRESHPEILDLAFTMPIEQKLTDNIKLEGRLVMSPGYDFSLSIRRFRMQELRMVITNDIENELSVFAGESVKVKYKRVIFSYWFHPIALGPVIVTPRISVNVGVEGEAKAGISSGVEITVEMEGGVHYQSNIWQPVRTFQTDYDAHLMETRVNASVTSYLEPRFDFYVYGVAGPYVNVKGYGEASWDMMRNPRYQVHAGVKSSAGAEMRILSRVIASYSLPDLFHNRLLIYEGGFHEDNEGDIEITTKPATHITSTSAQSGGDISDDGGREIFVRGVCWSIDPEPDLSDQCTQDGEGMGTYASQISGLDPSTDYYVRAYATNDDGTSYGNQIQFTTEEGIEDVPPGVNEFLSPENIDSLRERGLTIHTGLNPPDIQGNYYLNSLAESETGMGFLNYSYRFYNQTSDLIINVSYISDGGHDTAEGIGAFIAGEDQKFSIFVEEEGSVDFGTHVAIFNTATIYSGIRTQDGMEDFQFGFIVTHKENDLNNQLMNVGDTRVIFEEDGLAEQVPSFPHTGAPAKIMEKQLRMLIEN